MISVCAGAVFISFFLPWVSFLGAKLNGFDIGKNFTSYQLVWLMPSLATLVFLLNLARRDSRLIRGMAGLCPFAILIYAVDQMSADLFKIIEFGGWLALISGVALIFIPGDRKATIPA